MRYITHFVIYIRVYRTFWRQRLLSFSPLFVILNWPTSWVSCGQTQSECMSVPLHANALEISESEDHPLSPPEVVCWDWPGSWRACLFDLPSRREKKHAMTAWYWKASKHLYVLGIVRKDLDKHLIKQKSMICYRDVAGWRGGGGVGGGGSSTVRVLSPSHDELYDWIQPIHDRLSASLRCERTSPMWKWTWSGSSFFVSFLCRKGGERENWQRPIFFF